MQTFILILILALAIGLLIRLLHRYQLKGMKESADRSAPLPPLGKAPESPAIESAGERGAGDRGIPPARGTASWLERARALREAGDHRGAIELSRAHQPAALAYRQCAICLRAALKRVDGDAARQALLDELYANAALADLFRPASPLRAAAGDRDPGKLAGRARAVLVLPYQAIGYRQLDLLSKTDRKLLVRHWGEPAAHRHAEEALGDRWPALLENDE